MDIVTRAEWGAKPPKHAYHQIDRFQPTLILHHAAGAVLPGDDSVSLADLTRIRSIQAYHQNTQGWNDIAYSYLVDPDGFLFEGRGAGVANGATLGYGASSYAVCVMGHFDIQHPDSDLIRGLAAIVKWGYAEGLWPLGFTGGHRDYGSTSCPGDNLYPLIPEINRLAQEDDMASPTEWTNADWEIFRDRAGWAFPAASKPGSVSVQLTRIENSTDTVEAALARIESKVDAIEVGDGLTAAEVAAIVRAELNKTKLGI